MQKKKLLKLINKDQNNREWKAFDNYDLAINVDKLGVEETAEMLKNIVLTEDKNISKRC